MKAPASLLDTASFSQDDILALFSRAEKLERQQAADGTFGAPSRKRVLGFLFFEPSTRTRMSFQMAAERLGYSVLTLESAATSSLSKGETLSDTVLNVLAMKPDGLVIRYGSDEALDHLLPKIDIPVFSAGTGTLSHPTQALLDAFTIQRERGTVAKKKVLIVGDIVHSRVARSNFDVLTKLGAEVAVCGPTSLLPRVGQLPPTVKVFDDLDEACAWCDVYMGLRVQLERHDSKKDPSSLIGDYSNSFGLNGARLRKLHPDALILHPGPINRGVEFSPEVFFDSRNRVLKQVSNGVLIRAALLSRTFEDAR